MTILETKARNQLLGVLFAGVLMAALDIAIVGPALPAIGVQFGVDERALSWVFSAYVLTNLIGTPIAARLSDLFGRRSIYILNILLFALGSLIVAIAPSFELMLVGRAVQGFGAGGIFPVASAVIGDTFPADQRGRALGLIGAVFGMAFLLGPLIGGLLLRIASWHWLFFVNLPFAALVVALAWRHIPQRRPTTARGFDLPGVVIITALLAALAYGLTQLDATQVATSIASPGVWPFLLAALLLVPVLLLVERRAASPLINLALFRSRQVGIITAVAFGAGVAEAAVVFVPALLVAAFGVSNSTASFMLLPVVLAMAFGSPLAGRALDHVGSRIVIVIGCALVGAGLLLAGLLVPTYVSFYLSAATFGLGLSVLLGASLRYVMLNEASAADRASAQSLLTVFTNIGQLMGGVLVGALAASLGGGVSGYGGAFALVGGFVALLALLALGLKGQAAERAGVSDQTSVAA